jgi:hypothetical protein
MRIFGVLIFAFALSTTANAQANTARDAAAPSGGPSTKVVDLEGPDHATPSDGVLGSPPAASVPVATGRDGLPKPPLYALSNTQGVQEAVRQDAPNNSPPPTLAEIDRQFGTHYAADAARAAALAATQTMLFSYFGTIYIFGGLAYGLLVFLVSLLLIWRSLVRWIGKNGLAIGFLPAVIAAFVLAAGTALAWPLLILAPLLFIGAGNNLLADQIKAAIEAAKPQGRQPVGRR